MWDQASALWQEPMEGQGGQNTLWVQNAEQHAKYLEAAKTLDNAQHFANRVPSVTLLRTASDAVTEGLAKVMVSPPSPSSHSLQASDERSLP